MTISTDRPALGKSLLLAGPIVLAAGPVLADLTPADVWANWEAYLGASGYSLTATVTETSNGLKITDLQAVVPLSEDGYMAYSSGPILLQAQDADTVTYDLPDHLTLTFFAEEITRPGTTITFDISQIDARNVATGMPGAIRYDSRASQTDITLSKVAAANGPVPDDFSAAVRVEDWTTLSDILVSDTNITIDYSVFDVGALTGSFAFSETDGDDKMAMSFNAQDVSSKSISTMPAAAIDYSDPTALFAAGLDVKGDMQLGKLSFDLAGEIDGASFKTTYSARATMLKVVINQNRLGYEIDNRDMEFLIAGSQVPGEVAFTTEETGLRLNLPMQADEAAQEFGIGLKLTGLDLSDAIWAMFDPAAVLPRTPGDIVLDLDGTGILTEDLSNTEAMEALAIEGGQPIVPQTLALRALRLAAAGAVLDGSGGFTFTGPPSPFSAGLPSPVGRLDIDLKGANALLDGLIEMGVLSDQDAMAPRMMMGLLATPVGEDHLQSVIEMTDEGHIIANGQRIQ